LSRADLDVVGIGSMVVDRVHRAPRILGSDEKGILRDIDGAPIQLRVGGVVLNHLGWAALLGLRTGIFGRQADDAGGRFLRAAMDRSGIEHDIVLEGAASSVAEIFVDDAGARSIYMAPGSTSGTTAEHVRGRHADFIRRSARLSTEISQLPLEAVVAALDIARAAGIPTVLDLDVPPSDALPGLGDEAQLLAALEAADYLKPSKLAAAELVPNARGDALATARTLRERFGSRAVLVTDGAAGCAICSADFEGRVKAPAVDAIDTTGAGDAFLGGLLAALHYGLAWEPAAELANACGAACAEQMGAFPEEADRARARVLELYRGPAVAFAAQRESAVQTDMGGSPSVGAAAGRRVLEVAAAELEALRRRCDPAALVAAAQLIERSREKGGRLHVTGVGKPEHVAHYAASLLASTGTPATFLHATEAMHGSLGQLVAGDVVIAISNSGSTQELLSVVDAARGFGARVVGVTGRLESRLAMLSDVVLDAGVAREGGPLELEPRASVAAELLVLGALAAVLQERGGFTRKDYAARHPAGSVGRRAREGKDVG